MIHGHEYAPESPSLSLQALSEVALAESWIRFACSHWGAGEGLSVCVCALDSSPAQQAMSPSISYSMADHTYSDTQRTETDSIYPYNNIAFWSVTHQASGNHCSGRCSLSPLPSLPTPHLAWM